MFRPFLTLSLSFAICGSGLLALAQSGDDAVRVTVTMNPDGSKTVYQTDGIGRRSTATTTGANGKTLGKIIYQLDSDGRYESGEVFAAKRRPAFQNSLPL
jgi:hypothetical protein